MDDLISRRAAIEIFTQLWDCIGTIMDRDEWEDVCKTTANELPSAQQETHDKRTETHGVCLDDLIKRTDAIDAAIEAADEWDGGYNLTRSALIENAIKALPSAQQKPLKYTGESICLYCQTVNCDGCMYEPVMGVQ